MSDKLLLNYKGNLDVSDIPGALTGSKVSSIQKIQGRDYMKVHDIPGAIPKLNVGYTGHRRLDEEEYRGNSNDRQVSNQTDLIGRPQLRQRNQDLGPSGHHRGLSQNVQAHGNYQAVNAQQIDHQQLYHTFKQQEPPLKTDMNSTYQQHQSAVPKVNYQDFNTQQSNQQQQQQNYQQYEDALDKFMTERAHNSNNNHRSQTQLEQPSYQRSQSILEIQTPRQQAADYLNSGGLLSSRTSQVTKSTANLILKPKQEDLYSNLTHTQKKLQLKQTQADQSPKNMQESPHQVQKKIKDVQSSFVFNEDGKGSTLHTNYLDQLSSQKQQSDMLKQSFKKGNPLFKINASTIPETGRYDVNELQGSVKRSLCLAPSTSLGQYHKEEIEESIQNREYTKLGGGNTNVQMPNDLNNIQYHRKNPLKDYTYSALTGAYYYKAPN